MQESNIKETLVRLGLSSESSFAPIFSRVRDRADVGVLRCNQSGAIILDRADHMTVEYYEEKPEISFWNAESNRSGELKTEIDDSRRSEQFKNIVRDKILLDCGCGCGGTLSKLGQYARVAHGVEPQKSAREMAASASETIFADIAEAPDDFYDVITLFHVFEHIIRPVDFLRQVFQKLKKGGRILIEVPHASDFLIKFLDLAAFKQHTFWSEHLILHTRGTLSAFLSDAGFQDVVISGFQRYPLANHLHWLAQGKAGGHVKWSFLQSADLDASYENLLANLDMTDTIIAHGWRKE